ncbi:MAG: diguanylate cyclase [Sandaracinaceae bacterium]
MTRGKDPDVARTLQVAEGDDLRSRALLAAAQAKRRPVLVCVLGDDVGRRARIHGASFTVGRSHRADLVLNDPRVSSSHVRLEDRGDAWALVDLGSTNGTRVNGERARGERNLFANDKIEVGDSVLRFELLDAADENYEEHMARMIDLDDLTGLYTRRRFDAELARMIAVAAREGTSLGMLVMDLDGVKQINDTNGHLFGAYVIAESGKLIGRTLDEGAIAARFGGDEYVAAIPGAVLEGACDVAQAILSAVAAFPYEKDGIALRPGISIGVAVYPDQAKDAEALFRRADAALYAAKRAGKNRVCLAE